MEKRKTKMQPTGETLKACRAIGWLAGKVEQPPSRFSNNSHDLFGFADVVAVRSESMGSIYIQATTSDHAAERFAKMQEECIDAVVAVLLAGNRVEIWGWGRYSPRGTARVTIDARRLLVELVDGVLQAREAKSARELQGKTAGWEST